MEALTIVVIVICIGILGAWITRCFESWLDCKKECTKEIGSLDIIKGLKAQIENNDMYIIEQEERILDLEERIEKEVIMNVTLREELQSYKEVSAVDKPCPPENVAQEEKSFVSSVVRRSRPLRRDEGYQPDPSRNTEPNDSPRRP
jgi:hypothetical protein